MPEENLLAELQDRLEPSVRKAAARMFEELRRSFTLDSIEELIRSGDVTSAVLATLDDLFGGLREALVDVYEESGAATATLVGAPFVFDRLTDRGVGRLRGWLTSLNGLLREAQRAAILQAYSGSLSSRLTPAQQAMLVRAAIGLNSTSAAGLSSYVRGLLMRGAEPGNSLSPTTLARMAEAFASGMRRRRYATVAEAEALAAINMAAFEAFSQAEDGGAAVERQWVTRGDSHVRPSHQGLSGLVRGLNETFPGLDGSLRFPGDPQAPASERIRCRCHLTYRRNG